MIYSGRRPHRCHSHQLKDILYLLRTALQTAPYNRAAWERTEGAGNWLFKNRKWRIQFTQTHQNRTAEDKKRSDESRFLLLHSEFGVNNLKAGILLCFRFTSTDSWMHQHHEVMMMSCPHKPKPVMLV